MPPTVIATELRVETIVDTFNALTSLGKFPAGATQLKVARIIAALHAEARQVSSAERELLEDYALRDDEGLARTVGEGAATQILIDPKRRTEYAAKRAELHAGTVQIVAPRLTVFELTELTKKSGLDPGHLSYLLPFVDEPPPEPAAPSDE